MRARRPGSVLPDLIDRKRLDQLGTPEAAALKGSAAIANARLAYRAHEELTAGERWQRACPADGWPPPQGLGPVSVAAPSAARDTSG